MNFTQFITEIFEESEFEHKGAKVSINSNSIDITVKSPHRAAAVNYLLLLNHSDVISLSNIRGDNKIYVKTKNDAKLTKVKSAIKKVLTDAPEPKLDFKFSKVDKHGCSILGITVKGGHDEGRQIVSYINAKFKELGINGFINGHQNFHSDPNRYDVTFSNVTINAVRLALLNYKYSKFKFEKPAKTEKAKNPVKSLYFDDKGDLKANLEVQINDGGNTIVGKTVQGGLDYNGEDWLLDYKVGTKTHTTDIIYIRTLSGQRFNGIKEIQQYMNDRQEQYHED